MNSIKLSLLIAASLLVGACSSTYNADSAAGSTSAATQHDRRVAPYPVSPSYF
jgi:hypothetical protein